MTTVRLTMAQALVRFLAAQRAVCDGREVPLFGGVFAIFGHGNVAGVGEALFRHRAALPTYRAHNEQAMAHAAIAYAKAHFRRRMMACTTSIGPGATNLVTAAALAHVNRLARAVPAGRRIRLARARPGAAAGRGLSRRRRLGQRLLQAGVAVFRSHRRTGAAPGRVAAGDRRADRCRAVRPGDARAAAGRAGRGVRLPRSVFREVGRAHPGAAARGRGTRGSGGDAARGEAAADCRGRRGSLQRWRRRRVAPVCRNPSGARWPRRRRARARCRGTTRCSWARSASPARTAANALAREADLVLAIGTRLSDFTTGSHSLFGAGTATRHQRQCVRCAQVACDDHARRRRRHAGCARRAPCRMDRRARRGSTRRNAKPTHGAQRYRESSAYAKWRRRRCPTTAR